jgi:RNA polymerase sigma-70 factor (ECF subfamily)
MTEHRGIVVKIARSFTSSHADTEDLLQEILIRLWSSIDRYRGDANPSTWIYRVALNRALTWQRNTNRRSTASSTDELQHFVATTNVEDDHALNQLYEQIRGLPKIDRSLMLLSLDGLSYSEMSAITGISESNVGARLTRARKKLFAMIEEDTQ